MTGKELIVYILQNDLENEEVFTDDGCTLFMTETEAALALGTGIATVRTMFVLGMLKGFYIDDVLFLLRDNFKPAENEKKGAVNYER